MNLSAKDIVRLLDPSSMTAGAAMNRRRHASKPSSRVTTRQIAFLDAVIASKDDRKGDVVPTHPEAGATRAQYRRDESTELSPIELAWLDRLPRDPAAVTFEDAERLAALSGQISAMRNPQSALLIETVWAPVKALHDNRVAQAKLALAKQPLPRFPEAVYGAMADALESEHPGVPGEALGVMARQAIEEVRERQERDHSVALDRAQRQVDQLAQAQAERAALTRDAVG